MYYFVDISSTCNLFLMITNDNITSVIYKKNRQVTLTSVIHTMVDTHKQSKLTHAQAGNTHIRNPIQLAIIMLKFHHPGVSEMWFDPNFFFGYHWLR